MLGNHDTGTIGVNDRYAIEYFEGIGAEIMGAGKFGLHLFGDDPDWRGWWGDDPPFHHPVFVLTHTAPRPSIEMEGGTVFHFVSAPPAEVLTMAAQAADGADVRIGGGPAMVREFLKAGLIDVLHLAVTPIVLGQGENLWDDLRNIPAGSGYPSTLLPPSPAISWSAPRAQRSRLPGGDGPCRPNSRRSANRAAHRVVCRIPCDS